MSVFADIATWVVQAGSLPFDIKVFPDGNGGGSYEIVSAPEINAVAAVAAIAAAGVVAGVLRERFKR